jgi:hypothetical protein
MANSLLPASIIASYGTRTSNEYVLGGVKKKKKVILYK